MPAFQGITAAEEAVEAAVRHAREEMGRAGARTNKYAGATAVWNRWVAPDGILGELLTPVAQDDRQRLGVVVDRVVDLRSKGALDRAMKAADVRPTRREGIVAGAREKLFMWARDTIAIAATWADAVAHLESARVGSAPQAWQEAQASDLREAVRTARPDFSEALAGWAASRDPEEAGAAVGIAMSIDATLNLLAGVPLNGEEVGAREAVNRDLLLVPEVLLDDMEPAEPPPLAALCASRDWNDLRGAFDSRSRAGDHVGTELLIATVSASDPGARRRLRRPSGPRRHCGTGRPPYLATGRGRGVGTSPPAGFLDDERWARFSGQLEHIPTEGRFDFGRLRGPLEALRVDLLGERQAALDDFRARFDEVRSDALIAVAAERIEEALGAGDLRRRRSTSSSPGRANPCPNLLRRSPIRIQDFFPRRAATIAWPAPSTAVFSRQPEPARSGDRWSSVLFLRPTGPGRSGLEAWLRLTEREPAQWHDVLRPILDLLGIEAEKAVRAANLGKASDRSWVELKGFRRQGKASSRLRIARWWRHRFDTAAPCRVEGAQGR